MVYFNSYRDVNPRIMRNRTSRYHPREGHRFPDGATKRPWVGLLSCDRPLRSLVCEALHDVDAVGGVEMGVAEGKRGWIYVVDWDAVGGGLHLFVKLLHVQDTSGRSRETHLSEMDGRSPLPVCA